MTLEALKAVVDELKEDVREVKTDVKSLMIFMAVKKAEDKKDAKKTALIAGGGVSLVVAIVMWGIERLIK